MTDKVVKDQDVITICGDELKMFLYQFEDLDDRSLGYCYCHFCLGFGFCETNKITSLKNNHTISSQNAIQKKTCQFIRLARTNFAIPNLSNHKKSTKYANYLLL
jgi:hypothetical protein